MRRGLARDLAEVLRREVAAELADEQPQAGAAGARHSGRRRVGQRELAARRAGPDEDAVGATGGARHERREAELAAGVLERRALSELEHAQLRRRRDFGAPLHRGALEAEELEHRVAHARDRREHAARQHEQRHQGERERAAQARRGKQPPPRAAKRRALARAGARRAGRLGLAQARSHPALQVGRLRPVELAAELGEALLEVAHASTSPSSSRSRSSARDSRDLTVPRGQSSAAAVSSSLRSRR